jgi:vacuolar-type H+-ATPase subunit B/Vma2
MLKEYKTVSEISGPLMMVEGVEGAKYGHIVDIELADGSTRHGQILQVEKDKVLVQVFEGTESINVSGTTVRSWASRWNWRYAGYPARCSAARASRRTAGRRFCRR